ncbi:serine/threonine-protein kinase [Mycobacterium sp. shizuoka-1]|uniref:serine/threonine-protein kinase n=1 Tax=Mycobacterium sp. shizuoka-1 TaxID=2039281 RepID=UPI000C05FE38|nr:serine/threonine-protein kinase [Mycobacterium sp. shizuoka-1]GAY14881.1 protein kinase [Mycobacterium sp. shizuoka-1]
MLPPGQSVAGYVVDGVAGRGGQACVYLAHDANLRPVALKVLDDDHRDHISTARLAREFRLADRLRHPHIVAVYDHGPHWMTMQYVDGGNVTRLPSLQAKLEALAQIAAALDHAHHDGVVHSDVKPANILVHQEFSKSGAVLIDFGVAHVLAEDVWHRPAQVLASLPYAAPELVQGRLPQAATDEYALACTAVELLTGAPPFPADDPVILVDAHLHLPPPEVSRQTPWLSRSFDMVLARAIAKDPDRRYPSCTELVHQLAETVRRSV